MIFRYNILFVQDVPATVEFYKAAFGFELGFMHEGKDYAELVTGATKLAFSSLELMNDLGKSPAKADPKAPTFELAFETAEVEASLKQALTAGATLVEDLKQQPWGQTTCHVSDINGFLVEICSPVQSAG